MRYFPKNFQELSLLYWGEITLVIRIYERIIEKDNHLIEIEIKSEMLKTIPLLSLILKTNVCSAKHMCCYKCYRNISRCS